MAFDFEGFEAIEYDPKEHQWDSVSRQSLKFHSIRFDFDEIKLEVGLSLSEVAPLF